MRGIFKIQTILILFCLPIAFPLLSINSEAIGAPVVVIAFEEGEEEQIADVRPGEHGTVLFPGTVTGQLPAGSSFQDIIVDLVGSTDLDWSVTINPSQIQLNPGNVEKFTAQVTAPPGTSSSIVETLTVSGRARAFPGTLTVSIAPITGTIRIEQYYQFSLSSNEPICNSTIGEKVELNLDIYNSGNGEDTFSINVVNLHELSSKNIIITLSSTTHTIQNKQTGNVLINAEIPNNRNCIGIHYITLEVKSQEQEEIEGQAFPKTFNLCLRISDIDTFDDNSIDDSNDNIFEEPGDPSLDDFNDDAIDNYNPYYQEGPVSNSESTSESMPGFEGIYTILIITLVVIILSINKKRK
jgi:hypothetical protein